MKKDQGEEIEDDDEIEFRFDWMLLAEMGPNAVIDSSCDLGTRDIDRNHRWIDDARQRYLNTDLVDVDTFLQQVPRNNQMEDENLDIDYETLNEKQMVIFKRIKSHHRSVLTGYKVEALKMAGTESKSPVLVLVPTGVAAFNISGITIYSALSISVNDSNNLNLEDEKSMIGRQTLALIDVRLRQAFPEHKDRLFGGSNNLNLEDEKSMIGRQTLALIDVRLRQAFPEHKDRLFDLLSNNGRAAYKQFREVYKLDIIQRQSGDLEEQQEFRNILLRLRNGESTIDDWKILITRLEGKLTQTERNRFLDAIFVLPTWSNVNTVNLDRLRSLNAPVAKIHAIHTGGSEAKKADSDTAHDLEYTYAIFVLPTWSNVNTVNLDRLRSLNAPVAKIHAIHTGGSEAKKADSDTAHDLEYTCSQN
ncbi:hypothetical protein Glove_147g5 [Diversispora epigaea]|uniref:Uncharacterized protein n=1 Tax=Diversispora epigaea TaxID=1348612 RepID=A0A397J3D1_9GLOM|nr:hypothetical protein Glove_147g5 [Diversispora epigaea]